MKTYTIAMYAEPKAQMRAIDLREEIAAIEADGISARAGAITIFDGDIPHAETAEFLFDGHRLGIAWGADATWADVDDLESGIDTWLYDSEAWEARN